MPDNVASIKMGNILCAVAQGFAIPETDYPAQQLLRYAIQVGYIERVEILKITPKGTARMKELGDVPTPPSVPTSRAEELIVLLGRAACSCESFYNCDIHAKIVELRRAIVTGREAAHKAGLEQAAQLVENFSKDQRIHPSAEQSVADAIRALRATPAAPEEPRT